MRNIILTILVLGLMSIVHGLTQLKSSSTDKDFSLLCPESQVIVSISTDYSSWWDDREWTVSCAEYDRQIIGYNNRWAEKQNKYGENLDFSCDDNEALTGIKSTNDNKYEDRQFSLRCSSLQGAKIASSTCITSDYLNDYGDYFEWKLEEKDQPTKVLHGLASDFSKDETDRRWKVKTCNLCSSSVSWPNWGNWGRCPVTCSSVDKPGKMSRYRHASNQLRGVLDLCDDFTTTQVQNQNCNEKTICPVTIDGGFGCWSEWSVCSNSCGSGTQSRTRDCNNPSPQKGGAGCVGNSTESKPCFTARWSTTPDIGLEVDWSKVPFATKLNVWTMQMLTENECNLECLYSTYFKCQSYLFQGNECTLYSVTKRDAIPGITVVQGSEKYAGSWYKEKTCGVAEAALLHQSRFLNAISDDFSDGCDKKNCYASCGESQYVNSALQGTDVILRYLHFDLVSLHTIASDTAKKITVYAQSVVLSSQLWITYDLVIVARQVSISGPGIFRNGQKVDSCIQDEVIAQCSPAKTMKIVSYQGKGRVDIFALAVKGTETCTKGRILKSVPKQDLVQLKMAIACGQILEGLSKTGYSEPAEHMYRYIELVTSSPNLHTFDGREGQSLGSIASARLSKMIIRQKEGKRFIPLLSQKAYSTLLDTYAAILGVYNEKYERILSQSEHQTERLADIKYIVDKGNNAKQLQQQKLEFAKQAVDESTKTIKKMREEFTKSYKKLEAEQTALVSSIKKSKQGEMKNAAMNFAHVVGNLMSSFVTGPVGVISGVYELIQSVQGMKAIVQNMMSLIESVNSIQKIVDQLSQNVEEMSAPSDPAAIQKAIDSTADSRVKIVVWKNMKNMVNLKMTSIEGSLGYRQALADLTDWGQALTETMLNHGEVTRTYVVESLAKEIADKNFDAANNLLTAAKSKGVVTSGLLEHLVQSLLEVQLRSLQVVSEYCECFFYFNLKDCPGNDRLVLSDDLSKMEEKLHQTAQSRLDAAGSFGTNPPQPFTAHHILTDKANDDCSDPKKLSSVYAQEK